MIDGSEQLRLSLLIGGCTSASLRPRSRHRRNLLLQRFEDPRLLMGGADKVIHVRDLVLLEKGGQLVERPRQGKRIDVTDGSEGNGTRSGGHEFDHVAVVVHSPHAEYRNAH